MLLPGDGEGGLGRRCFFRPPYGFADYAPRLLTPGDFDQDGNLDIVAFGGYSVDFFRGDGAGALSWGGMRCERFRCAGGVGAGRGDAAVREPDQRARVDACSDRRLDRAGRQREREAPVRKQVSVVVGERPVEDHAQRGECSQQPWVSSSGTARGR